jgi:hypothetical protein
MSSPAVHRIYSTLRSFYEVVAGARGPLAPLCVFLAVTVIAVSTAMVRGKEIDVEALSRWLKADVQLRLHRIHLLLVALGTFSLLWSVRVMLSMVGARRTGTRSETAHRTWWVGPALGVAAACTIAIVQGAEPVKLAVLHWFYVVVIPALMGLGWTAPRRTRPSAIFLLAVIVASIVFGSTALPRPFVERHFVTCQWWFEHGKHGVLGFTDVLPPPEWTLLEWALLPQVLVEIATWHVIEPLTEPRC